MGSAIRELYDETWPPWPSPSPYSGNKVSNLRQALDTVIDTVINSTNKSTNITEYPIVSTQTPTQFYDEDHFRHHKEITKTTNLIYGLILMCMLLTMVSSMALCLICDEKWNPRHRRQFRSVRRRNVVYGNDII